MANPEHLAKLQEGVIAWNAWRTENPDVGPDLTGANLREANLCRVNLRGVNLIKADLTMADLTQADLTSRDYEVTKPFDPDRYAANLSGANLSEANLYQTDFTGAFLTGVNFRKADLNWAILIRADLTSADLTQAKLIKADLNLANLRNADFTNADLHGANLTETILCETVLGGARFWETIFNNINLSAAKGLRQCWHDGPSGIDHRTLEQSGPLPEQFLRGCGFSKWEITASELYDKTLTPHQITDRIYQIIDLRSHSPIPKHNVFISYSHENANFIDALEPLLDNAGILFWRDIHHAVAGRLDKNIERGMRSNPIVLVVLSEASVNSPWVEHEVGQAITLRRKLKRDVLCPITLDDSWESCDWSAELRTQIQKYQILDFSQWADAEKLNAEFHKLITGLDLFYLPPDLQES